MNVIYASINNGFDGVDIETQVAICRQYAKCKGMEINRIYIDDSIPQIDSERSGYRDLLKEVNNIENIFTFSIITLDSNIYELYKLVGELNKKNIQVFTADKEESLYCQFLKMIDEIKSVT